jgi:hypothetical protein
MRTVLSSTSHSRKLPFHTPPLLSVPLSIPLPAASFQAQSSSILLLSLKPPEYENASLDTSQVTRGEAELESCQMSSLADWRDPAFNSSNSFIVICTLSGFLLGSGKD